MLLLLIGCLQVNQTEWQNWKAQFDIDAVPIFTEMATISPNLNIKTQQELLCSAAGIDENNIALNPSFEWYNGNTLLAQGVTYTIDASETNVGDEINCTATLTDTFGRSVSSSASVFIENTEPTIDAPSITSDTGQVYNNSTITCSATAHDADEELQISYSWQENGSEFSTDPVLSLSPSSFSPDQSITCEASTIDSQGSSASNYTTITIGNRDPLISNILISEQNPEANSELSCSAVVNDPDGEEVTPSYVWSLDGTTLSLDQNLVLDPSFAYVDAPLQCIISASDSYGGMTEETETVTVQNTPPEIDQAIISPDTGVNADSLLTCSANGFDLNDGELSPTYEWSNNGTVLGSGSIISLNSAMVSPNDTLRCTATAEDAALETTSSYAEVVINNSPPFFTNFPQISPNSNVYIDSSLTCSAEIADVDDGLVPIQYIWRINGTAVINGVNGSVIDLSLANASIGDTIECSAEGTDAHGAIISDSISVAVENRDPIITSTEITIDSGNTAYNDSILTCTSTGSDADNSVVVFTYTWLDGTTPLFTGPSFDLSTSSLLPGDILTCQAEANDGNGGSSLSQINIEIGNRAPSISEISINPVLWTNFIESTSDATCQIVVDDPDEEPLNYTYTWTSTSGSTFSGEVLPASQMNTLEYWSCEVIVSDQSQQDSITSSQMRTIDDCSLAYCDFSLDLGNNLFLEMNLIPAGTDVWGIYSLSSDFYMMTTKATQGMYYQLIGEHSYQNFSVSDSNGSLGIGDNYPAYYSNWNMAAAFANEVTQIHNSTHGTNLSNCYSCTGSGNNVSCSQESAFSTPYQCDGYRLPTEAEFEYATRSGSSGDFWTPNGGGSASDNNGCTGTETIEDGSTNPPLLDDYVWYCGNNNINGYPYGSKEVAQKLPNGFGLYDLQGNLKEWLGESNDCAYPKTGTDPFCQSPSSTSWIIRNGPWYQIPAVSKSSSRGSGGSDVRNQYISFRLVRSL